MTTESGAPFMSRVGKPPMPAIAAPSTAKRRERDQTGARAGTTPASGSGVDGAAARRPRVGLVDDHHLLREGLRLILDAHAIDVVGESSSAAGSFELIDRESPDVLLLDVTLPDGDGVSLLREIHARYPGLHVIVLTMHRDPETVRQSLLAGADGYVVKGARPGELIEAIEAVLRGDRYLHSSVTSFVVDDSLRWLSSGTTLTAREREILSLLGAGLTTAQVGRQLGISPHTVRRHIANLTGKLGVRGIAGLVQYSIREGLSRDVQG